MSFLKRKLRQFKEYDDIAEIGEIARRYFVMNAFDGILTIIGVLTGSYVAHVALVDGLAPFLSALVALLPFFFSASLGDIYLSYYLSLGIALLSLFGLGAFLGMVSRGNFALWGLKMIGAGLLSIVLGYLLGGLEG